jgi:hypothetical protein
MITTPIKTSFFIKKKTKRTDVSTVFFRMTHQDHSATISLKIDIKTADWDEHKCHVQKSHPAHNQPNPDVLAEEIIENLEAGIVSFKEIQLAVGGRLGR